MSRILLLNKPYGVLSQFTDSNEALRGGKGERPTLAQYVQASGVFPAGRLDRDSEGLLVLTDDGQLQHKISHPQNKLTKCYWVQVEGEPTEVALQSLRDGVQLKDGLTAPAKARHIGEPVGLWERNPPVRYRKQVSDSWIELTIAEGRNRQVRRMTAAVGHPTLRLIRYRVGSWTIDGLSTGEVRSL